MFKKILIANRGEIALRIARTCRGMGIAVATVHSQADANALHVRDIGESVLLGPAPARASYLNIERVVQAALLVGADAVHPGYGFLSENVEFAEALAAKGIAFIGPVPKALRQFGDKSAAKALAVAAGLPVIPGSNCANADPATVHAMVEAIGLPALLKAAAGGGGKGIRIVRDWGSLADDIAGAMREGLNAFGDASLLVEKYLPGGRHVEVQILGDGHGKVIHLWERECSLQRRYQKVVEEAPALTLPAAMRQRMLDAAVGLGQHVNYRALGTVEFLVTGDDFYFLEVNPRLQVEHPVTEAVTGLDLVALQIQAARGVALELAQADVPCQGHAIEVRVYAEDAQANFMPSTGVLHHLALPHECARVETGIETGSVITPHYDPMVAKLIVQGDDRQQAIARMRQALSRTRIVGVANNLDFADALFQASEVVTEVPTTATIDTLLASLVTPQPAWVRQVGALAAAYVFQQSRSDSAQAASSQWRGLTHWRLGATQAYVPSYPQYEVQVDAIVLEATVAYLVCRNGLFDIKIGDRNHTVGLGTSVAGQPCQVMLDGLGFSLWLGSDDGAKVWVSDGRQTCSASVLPLLRHDKVTGAQTGGAVTAPLTGKVLELRVAEGDSVEAGQVLLVLESMKMELRITAPVAGVVKGLATRPGASVERGAVLARVEASEQASSQSTKEAA
jgi:3-methylcrotonyl-CoA carboxylase alpha subunit